MSGIASARIAPASLLTAAAPTQCPCRDAQPSERGKRSRPPDFAEHGAAAASGGRDRTQASRRGLTLRSLEAGAQDHSQAAAVGRAQAGAAAGRVLQEHILGAGRALRDFLERERGVEAAMPPRGRASS